MFAIPPGFLSSSTGSSSTAYVAAVTSDSPLSWWRLGETSDTVAADSGSTGNAGTYAGGFTLGTAGLITGDSDKAVTLNGTNGLVGISAGNTPAALNLSRSYSLEAWINPQGNSTYRTIINFCDGGYDLRISNSNELEFLKSNTSLVGTGAATLAISTRYHIVVTVDASGNWVIYVNGASDATGTTAVTFSGGTGLRIGANLFAGSASEVFNGVIDEVAIYGSALSAARVSAHYAAGL